MAAEAGAVQVAFPEATSALLEALNQQRLEGQLCDLAIHVQGRVFRAHRAVLAACSPYFHDQVLLKDMSSVVLPSVMDPAAFELVLGSAYTGRLRMGRDEIVNFLTVGSVLQMWHIVDTCTQLLKERQRRPDRAAAAAAAQASSSSSSGSGASRGSGGRGGGGGGGESQSPSSSSYFSPRRDGPEQPRAGGGARGGGERDEDGLCRAAPRRRPPDPFARAGRSAPEPDDGAPGEPGSSEARRPSSLRPSLGPPRQWLPVKKERGGLEEEEEEEEDDEEEEEEDLVLTCEEDEEPAEPAAALSISDVRTLSGPPPPPPPEEQVNFCESSQDVAAAFEEPFPPSRPLLPLDVRGPPLLLFPGAAGSSGAPSAVGAAPPSSVEHGAVQLSGGSGEGSKIFLCHCGKAFSHKSMRDRHVNMHLNLRPFDCPVCNKKFKMKHHLTEHMKTHTGLKPYECHVCAKKFMWRDSFMRHKGHCERRHRLGGGGGGGGPAALCGGAKKEDEEGASPSCVPGEAEWATGRSPRSELAFAGSSQM